MIDKTKNHLEQRTNRDGHSVHKWISNEENQDHIKQVGEHSLLDLRALRSKKKEESQKSEKSFDRAKAEKSLNDSNSIDVTNLSGRKSSFKVAPANTSDEGKFIVEQHIKHPDPKNPGYMRTVHMSSSGGYFNTMAEAKDFALQAAEDYSNSLNGTHIAYTDLQETGQHEFSTADGKAHTIKINKNNTRDYTLTLDGVEQQEHYASDMAARDAAISDTRNLANPITGSFAEQFNTRRAQYQAADPNGLKIDSAAQALYDTARAHGIKHLDRDHIYQVLRREYGYSSSKEPTLAEAMQVIGDNAVAVPKKQEHGVWSKQADTLSTAHGIEYPKLYSSTGTSNVFDIDSPDLFNYENQLKERVKEEGTKLGSPKHKNLLSRIKSTVVSNMQSQLAAAKHQALARIDRRLDEVKDKANQARKVADDFDNTADNLERLHTLAGGTPKTQAIRAHAQALREEADEQVASVQNKHAELQNRSVDDLFDEYIKDKANMGNYPHLQALLQHEPDSVKEVESATTKNVEKPKVKEAVAEAITAGAKRDLSKIIDEFNALHNKYRGVRGPRRREDIGKHADLVRELKLHDVDIVASHGGMPTLGQYPSKAAEHLASYAVATSMPVSKIETPKEEKTASGLQELSEDTPHNVIKESLQKLELGQALYVGDYMVQKQRSHSGKDGYHFIVNNRDADSGFRQFVTGDTTVTDAKHVYNSTIEAIDKHRRETYGSGHEKLGMPFQEDDALQHWRVKNNEGNVVAYVSRDKRDGSIEATVNDPKSGTGKRAHSNTNLKSLDAAHKWVTEQSKSLSEKSTKPKVKALPGERPVETEQHQGVWAVHPSTEHEGEYTVTHAPSGMAVAHFGDKTTAQQRLNKYLQNNPNAHTFAEGVDHPSKFKASMEDLKKHVKGIRGEDYEHGIKDV